MKIGKLNSDFYQNLHFRLWQASLNKKKARLMRLSKPIDMKLFFRPTYGKSLTF